MTPDPSPSPLATLLASLAPDATLVPGAGGVGGTLVVPPALGLVGVLVGLALVVVFVAIAKRRWPQDPF